jgi:hypothetical protein
MFKANRLRGNLSVWWILIYAPFSGCSSQVIKFIHPQSGATAECSASGVGIGASFSEGFVSSCGRGDEDRGYIRLEQLTPEQRTDLERRGLLPKN